MGRKAEPFATTRLTRWGFLPLVFYQWEGESRKAIVSRRGYFEKMSEAIDAGEEQIARMKEFAEANPGYKKKLGI